MPSATNRPLLSLKQDKSLPTQAQKTLNRVCLSVNRMLKLIDQMLDFNQLETDALRLKVAQVDARKELQQLIASFEESTRVKGIKLETRFEDGNYLVWLDNDKLEKVMDNLFTNALKHTSNQGIIRITAILRMSLLKQPRSRRFWWWMMTSMWLNTSPLSYPTTTPW